MSRGLGRRARRTAFFNKEGSSGTIRAASGLWAAPRYQASGAYPAAVPLITGDRHEGIKGIRAEFVHVAIDDYSRTSAIAFLCSLLLESKLNSLGAGTV